MVDPKVAVVGCGRWGQHLIRNFSELGVLSAVSADCPSHAQSFIKRFNVPFLTFEQILESDQVTAVVLATPAHTHQELGARVLKTNKDLYVEKPLAMSVADAKSLVDLSQNSQKTLMTGHLLQYHAAYLKLKELVQDGLIGDVRLIYTNRLGCGRVRRSENVLWDLLPHDLSLVLGLVDSDVATIQGHATGVLDQETWDNAHVSLGFENGEKVFMNTSWTYPGREQSFIVIGEKGALVFNDTHPWSEKLAHYTYATTPQNLDILIDAQKSYVPLEEAEPLRAECEHFVNCLKSGITPRTGPQEALRVTKVLEAIEQALKG